MALDLKTLYVAMLGTAFIMGSVLCSFALSKRDDHALWQLVWCNYLTTLACFLFIQRPLFPCFLTIIIANLIYVSTFLLLARIYRSLFDLPPRKKVEFILLPVFVSGLLFFTYVSPDIHARITIVSFTCAVPTLLTAWDLWRVADREPRAPTRAGLFFFALYGCFIIARGINTQLSGIEVAYFALTSLFETVLVLLSICLVIGWNVSYVWIAYARADLAHNRALAELEKANEKLRQVNAGLERFASVVAHDLKAPLNTVRGYVGLLRLDAKTSDSDKAVAYALNAEEGAKRMADFIDDVLTYTKATASKPVFTSVDMNDVCAEALQNLDGTIKDTKADIQVDKLPSVLGDRTQLIRVFQNIVDNAIKYKRPDTAPIIRIGCAASAGFFTFSVSDSGIGMDMNSAQQVFELFERSTTAQLTISGTGLGLTTCKQIVEHHGGRIWVESQPDQGSTFFFSLPS